MTTLSEQQERFCRFIVEGKTQTEAYKLAGYKSKDDDVAGANASRLIGNERVAARIAELRKPLAKKAEVTLEWLIGQAQDVLEAARTDGAHAASIAAIKELGILSGERVEQRLNTNRDVNDTSDLSREELLDIARAGRPGTPAKANGAGKPGSVH